MKIQKTIEVKKVDDDEEEEEEEVEVKTKESSSNPVAILLGNKLLRIMFILIGFLLLLLLVLYIASLTSKKTYTYEDVEGIMKTAAESYFKDHPESLPKDEGTIVSVDSSNLIAEGKMKSLSEYLGEEKQCSGNVKVEKIGTKYLYIPNLNCGTDYESVELYRKVLEQPIVTERDGLYSMNGTYVFRGERVNNYVQLDKSLWRIVRITSNNNVVLVSEEGLPFSQPWDDRYNEVKMYESGINQYDLSRIKDYLKDVYSNPNEEDNEDILSDSDKAKIVPYTMCVGKRAINSEKKNNSEECQVTIKNQRLGLLTLSDYLLASTSEECKSANTQSCENYNYLTIRDDWWLATANSEDTYSVYCVARSGNVKLETASNYAVVRPVIYLRTDVSYKEGTGTKDDPYIVK